ncbi:hypothetical protein ACR78F_11825 [Sphingobacterium spiritivorum]|uniref:hypothetical protein n=1 Tax=Sphingobacterium spiritivorum TaxID=258 RepID=UPI003DA3A35D
MRIIFFILIIFSFFSSCILSEKEKVNSDFSFYLPDANLYITTSKRLGGDFYVMFSKTDSISQLSDSTDYIKCDIKDEALVIILDPNNKNDLYFMYSSIKKINKKRFNLIELDSENFTNRFYYPGSMTNPDTLKNPYKKLLIAPKSYNIIFQRDSSFNSQIIIKNGNMWGE